MEINAIILLYQLSITLGADMRIISLIENTSGRKGIVSEHGLSLYIEAVGKRILFDFGQSDSFADNADRLTADLSAVDLAILSHGHYDHGGGLRKFLEINKKAAVYISKKAFLPYYNGEKYIGLDPSLSDSDRLIFIESEQKICEGLTLISLDSPPENSAGLTVMTERGRLPDRFDHEQYLLIEENGRRVLISGCSHKGILSIIKKFQPDIFVGGFHFMAMPLDEELSGRAKELELSGCKFYTCHCTGKEQFDFIKTYINRLEYLSAGDRIEI